MNFELLGSKKDSYKFNEIASLSGVKPYVLRFWESEFSQISPALSKGGDKLYSDRDLEAINKIKELLFDQKLSIPEAKENLSLAEKKNQVQINMDEESRTTIGVAAQSSSLDLMRSALEVDINLQKSAMSLKQFNDEDVLNLVHAKKKLSSVLAKINGIIKEKNWMES